MIIKKMFRKLINIDSYDFEFQESNSVCNEPYDSELYAKFINLYDAITDFSIQGLSRLK